MNNIYDVIKMQLYRLFELVDLIKSYENIIDSILGENFYSEEFDFEINYENIGRRLVDFVAKREEEGINESHLHILMLAKISDLIMSTIELDARENATFFDLSGRLINVQDELQSIFFDEEIDVNKKVNEFVEFHINRLIYRGMNDFVNHDFNIEDWVFIDENTIGLYLDNAVYHHYGCWIPEKFLNHLGSSMRIPLKDETELQLFFKKKAYYGILKLQEGKIFLYWDNTLRRRINKKYPQIFTYEEVNQTNQRVLMSFFYHENFEDNFIKIDFKLVDNSNG